MPIGREAEMAFDELIRDALHGIDDYEPSPDLFERVRRSIADTRTHRRRVLGQTLGVAGLVTGLGVGLAVSVETVAGVTRIAHWKMEVLEVIALAALVILVGPSLRRFGRTYLAGVMPRTADGGRSFLGVIDIAFYLVFTAVILLGTDLTGDPVADPARLAVELEDAAIRLGSLALTMGVLHAATMVLLPFVGLVATAASWRRGRAEIEAVHPGRAVDPEIARIERTAGRLVWILPAMILAVPIPLLVLRLVVGFLP
jgi:hypothetical protein